MKFILFLFCFTWTKTQCELLQAVLLDENNPNVNFDEIADTDPLFSDTVVIDDSGVPGTEGASHTDGSKRVCDDIAIIGAGISGSFIAWRLRNSNKSISVYEYSHRIGGRIFTSHIHGVKGFKAELGAMRFHESSHQLLNKTARHLGLTVIDFPLGYGASDSTLMFLRGVHMRYNEVGSKMPYNLKPEEKISYRQILRNIYVNSTDYSQHKHRDSFHLKTHDGLELYKQSIQAVFAKTISTELAHYIKDINSFLSDFGTTSAAYALPASDPITPGESSYNMKTIKEGFSTIPKRLINKFKNASSKHHVLLNYNLKGITKNHDGTYQLHFDNHRNHAAHDQCAKKVVLAINRLALEHLNWSVLKQPNIRNLITKSVRDAHAVKFFLAYDQPWWKKSNMYSEFAISDTPIHRTYDFGPVAGTNISVLDAVYSDNDVTLWEELVKRGPRISGNSVHSVTPETVFIIHKYLAAIYNIDMHTIPKPVGGVIGIWDAYPIGGAWCEWLPGYIMPDVEKQMVKPSSHDEVYVASNAFNSKSLSFWSESALEAAELVLEHFNITTFKT
ncbi:IL4I1 [Mytilus edulis]|uniref:IL4I1 n=1 Tax=Mytilus edulis TaxID=6550 RepID=A0A8S3U8X6_MYTED|nr:IL4I1 [Mytilus edulis]